MKKLLLLDFDRTLFNSEVFINELWLIISTKYKLNFTDMVAELVSWFQNLKMSFTRVASDLPRDIILSAKNEFIADHIIGPTRCVSR